MKSLCYILCVAITVGVSAGFRNPAVVPEDRSLPEEELTDIATRGWILNKEGKEALKNVLNTFPCGWPEYGIPPLAPYTNKELTINVNKGLIETITKLIRFRVDGLDIMLINELKIGYTFNKKVKFNLTYPKIILSGKVVTDILINLMEEYGISIRYEGQGDFEIMLEDITFKGSFKYKMPFIFGSIKIYKFNCNVSLGRVVSSVGLFSNDKFNQLLNDKIEEYLWKAVNYNENRISTKIEETVVPLVNENMTGHKIWYVIGKLGGSGKVCHPPADPWAVSDKSVL